MRLIGLLAAVAMTAGVAASADWSQWRGPGRNGLSPDATPLATSWPAGGPKKAWQSEKIPAGSLGSVVVAGGKAFVLGSVKFNVPIPERKLSNDALRNQLGWSPEKLPEELSKKVEAARAGEERAKLTPKELGPWVEKWVKENVDLPADQVKKAGPVVRDRLNRGAKALPLDVLDKLAAIKDKVFPTQEDLDKWYEEAGLSPELKKIVSGVIPTTKAQAKDYVYCLNAEDGKTAWNVEYPGQPRDYGACSTPCVAGDRVLVIGSDSDVYCLSAKDGQELWKRKCGGGEKNSSFLVLDKLAIVQAGPLTALNLETGEVAWTQKAVSAAHNSPVTWVKDGKTYLICNTEGNVACVDPGDGKLLWSAPGGGYSTAVVEGDFMVILSGNGGLGLVAYKLATDKPERLWSFGQKPAPKPTTTASTTVATAPAPPPPPPGLVDRGASPLIYKGHVYATAGGWSACVELATGKLCWYEKTPTQEIGSPLLSDGKILCLSSDAKLLLMLQASPEKYGLLGKTNVGAAPVTSLGIADGRVYIRLGNGVGCYDLSAAGNPTSAPATKP